MEKKRLELFEKWGFEPVPDEKFPKYVKMITEPIGSAQNYNFYSWGDLFNSRQKMTLITFVEKIRQSHEKLIAEGAEEEYAKAVVIWHLE